MDKHQRIRAALAAEPVDRLPLSLWRHYHCADRDAADLATVTLDLADSRLYRLDARDAEGSPLFINACLPPRSLDWTLLYGSGR